MGLEPLEPGFKKMRIKPQPGPLTWAKGRFPTVKGDVGIRFETEPGSYFSLSVSIPPNVEAEVWLPVGAGAGADPEVTKDGQAVGAERRGQFVVVENACSGEYQAAQRT